MRKGEAAPNLPLGSLWFDWGEKPQPHQGSGTAGAESKALGLGRGTGKTAGGSGGRVCGGWELGLERRMNG